MALHLFAYGSLMLPEILGRITQRSFTGIPASLIGWQRYRVHAESYPAIVPHCGGRVEGILWLGLSDREIFLLDAFEGYEYRRIGAFVFDASNIDYPAQTYAWSGGGGLTNEAWDIELFRTRGMKGFSQRYL
jgi:gamma-glutamylcyclotransferase (GGCT)/AIG2-like uncharacterized protein YtfP